MIRLPVGEGPHLFKVHGELKGNLSVTFDDRSREGLHAKVKAGHEILTKHDPNLAERLAKECGCALSWTY